MSFSSVSVVSNALRLKLLKRPGSLKRPGFLKRPGGSDTTTAYNDYKEKGNKNMLKTLKIEGMSCSHCVMAVTKALSAVSGVDRVSVDLDSRTAKLDAEAGVTDDMLIAAVDDAGYEVVGIG